MRLKDLEIHAPASLAHSASPHTLEYAEQVAPRLGGELRQRYVDCAGIFRRIVRAAKPTFAGPGAYNSSLIMLGPRRTSIGEVPFAASVYLHECWDDSPFCVITKYAGKLAGEDVMLEQEPFGANVYAGLRTPEFVRNPDSTCPDPYDITNGMVPGVRSHIWTADNYADIADALDPMIAMATDTQRLLVGSLCDPRLNPELAAHARTVFPAAA